MNSKAREIEILILAMYSAIPLYAKVLEQQPGNQRLAFFLAVAHAGVGDEAKAIEVLRTAGTAENDLPGRIQELRSHVGPAK